ncbi:MAG: TetR/AcrR family transcriptional regulator [Kordiimonas sp.]
MAKAKRAKPTFIEEARQRQIQEIARGIFARVGFQQTSLAEIAKAADISKGVIIYHYGSKSELGKAVLRDTLKNYGDFLGEQLEKHNSAKHRLLEVPSACAAYIEQNRNPFLLYIDVLGSFGDLEEKRAFMAQTNQVQRSFLIRLIEDCMQEGYFPSSQSSSLADVVQASLDGLMGQYSVDPEATDLKACAKLLREFISSLM